MDHTYKSLGLIRHDLGDGSEFHVGRIPDHLRSSRAAFDTLWNEHPQERHEIMMHGRLVKTPRWQQAYGKDYHYTGRNNVALPLLPELLPLFEYVRHIDHRLDGVLVNWYDARYRHYIGKHRDSRSGMIDGAPIVTVSLGAARLFRIRPWKGKGMMDFDAVDGALFVMPYRTNLAFTHEVPHRSQDEGRRISVTFRAFK